MKKFGQKEFLILFGFLFLMLFLVNLHYYIQESSDGSDLVEYIYIETIHIEVDTFNSITLAKSIISGFLEYFR